MMANLCILIVLTIKTMMANLGILNKANVYRPFNTLQLTGKMCRSVFDNALYDW